MTLISAKSKSPHQTRPSIIIKKRAFTSKVTHYAFSSMQVKVIGFEMIKELYKDDPDFYSI